MKNSCLYRLTKKLRNSAIFISLIISALIFVTEFSIAQDSKENNSKLALKIQVNPIVSNGIRSVMVQVRRKENKKTVLVNDVKSPLHLYFNEVKKYNPVDGTGWINKLYLDQEGTGIFKFPSDFNKLTSGSHEYTFIVKMDSDPKYEDVQEEITISEAKIVLEYNGEDSIKTATASLSAWNEFDYVPVPEVELKLSIKRAFNSLPFGEEGLTTDENGEVTGELPLDLPGNANGTITIVARLEDDETYGTVETTADVPWAVLPKVNPIRGRTLWSSRENAPLLLVISSMAIIVIIWGIILYLMYLLFRINRLGKAPS